jgi:hypothetical protein
MEPNQTRDVAAVLRAELEREEASGFAFLRSLPNGTTARFLSLFGQLTTAEKQRTKHAIARTRATWFGAPTDPEAEGVMSALTLMAFQQQPPPWPHPANVPNARELKKLAALAMSQSLGARPARTDIPGEWEYAGVCVGEAVRVRLLYNTRLVPLEYSIHPARLDHDPDRRLLGVGYEWLVGFGIGRWDQITLGNVDQSFAALNDVIRRTMRLVRSLSPSSETGSGARSAKG